MTKKEKNYLKELEKIKKEKEGDYTKKFKEGYKQGKQKSDKEAIESLKKMKNAGANFSQLPKEGVGYFTAIANNLMKHATEQKDPEIGLYGAQIYEALGYGKNDSVKRRLLKSIENSKRKIPFGAIEDFYERNKKRRRIGF